MSVANRDLHKQAIELRKQGKTYGDIKQLLNLPKSTLSDWLRDYQLNPKQLALSQNSKIEKRKIAIEKTIIRKKEKHVLRLNETYKLQKEKIIPLSKGELYIAGLFLYWGEGNKGLKGALSLNNTDPSVLLFFLHWLTYSLNIPKEKIKVTLHLYSDMNIEKEMNYWSKLLRIPRDQFSKPYIKHSKLSDINQIGFGHGTCGLWVADVLLKETVLMSIKVISDFYNPKAVV